MRISNYCFRSVSTAVWWLPTKAQKGIEGKRKIEKPSAKPTSSSSSGLSLVFSIQWIPQVFCSTSVLGTPPFALKKSSKSSTIPVCSVWVLSESWRHSRASLPALTESPFNLLLFCEYGRPRPHYCVFKRFYLYLEENKARYFDFAYT